MNGCGVAVVWSYAQAALHIATLMRGGDMIRALVANGAKIDTVEGERGATALMLAAEGGSVRTIRTLLELKAAVDIRDQSGKVRMQSGLNCSSGNSADGLTVFDLVCACRRR